MNKRSTRRRVLHTEPEPGPEMNTTPLIDVMLVLLVMLIITIPIQLGAVNLNLPTGASSLKHVEPEIVKIDIDGGSQIHWQGQPMQALDRLQALMMEQSRKAVPPEIHIQPDRHAKYAAVASVLAAAHRAGLTKIGVVGSEQFGQ